MKKICIIGHFGIGKNLLNGQTIKTKIVADELKKHYGDTEILEIDTHGGVKTLPRLIIQLICAFKMCRKIIILPAQNGVRILVPLCNGLNKIYKRKLYYIVIGGWLPELINGRKKLERELKKFNGVYVETSTMERNMKIRGFNNVRILPNFKPLKVLSENQLVYTNQKPYRVCTFSRVMREKGIQEAIECVVEINKKYDEIIYELDIYGQIDEEQIEWFDRLIKESPQYIKYKGMIQYNESVEVLKEYFLLLFPTHFSTEGIPGTILDAYAAGVPVLSAKWNSFGDVVDDQKTGIGYTIGDYGEMKKKLMELIDNPQYVNDMKKNCLRKIKQFTAKTLIDDLNIE